MPLQRSHLRLVFSALSSLLVACSDTSRPESNPQHNSPSSEQIATKVLQDQPLLDELYDGAYESAHAANRRAVHLRQTLADMPPGERLERLIELLGGSETDSFIAAGRLSTMGESAVPRLVLLLDPTKDLRLRKHAARALGMIGTDACPAVRGLRQLARHDDAITAWVAREALAKIGPCDAD